DGIGEVAFAYRADCVSDMSPVTVKLLLLENGDKYILRGTTRIEDPGGAYGGDLKVDPSFTKGPKEFLAHAKALWERESPSFARAYVPAQLKAEHGMRARQDVVLAAVAVEHRDRYDTITKPDVDLESIGVRHL